ncbi:MAG: glycosyltransferase family 2 protein [Phycisphaerae bacterium]
MSLLIVIVNFRTPDLTIDALASLVPELTALTDPSADQTSGQMGKSVQVGVVENGSGDDSALRLQQAIADRGWSWCQLLVEPKNLGFAGGNNLALRPALQRPAADRPEFVILLNPDTLVRPGAFQELVTFMRNHPQVGIAGSRLEDPDGTPQRSAFQFPNPWTELNDTLRIHLLEKTVKRSVMAPPVRDEAHETDWVAGASMIIRPAVFDEIGLLDEDYFVYFEEVDFCLRARRAHGAGGAAAGGGMAAGWRCWYVPASRVVHLVGMSSHVNNPDMVPKRRPRYWFDARKRFYQKNYGLIVWLLADLAWMAGWVIFRIRRWLQRRPTNDPPWFLWDFIRYTYFPDTAR